MKSTAMAEAQPEHGLDADELCGLELLEGVSAESVSGLLQRCSVRSVLEGEPGMTAAKLLAASDAALYRAKRDGRNRVCL